MSGQRNLLCGLVTVPQYIFNSGGLPKAYCSATPVAGTVLFEVTGADEAAVREVKAGTPHPEVLWEAWTPGISGAAATDAVDVPWTCIRVTATNAYVNIAGGG